MTSSHNPDTMKVHALIGESDQAANRHKVVGLPLLDPDYGLLTYTTSDNEGTFTVWQLNTEHSATKRVRTFYPNEGTTDDDLEHMARRFAALLDESIRAHLQFQIEGDPGRFTKEELAEAEARMRATLEGHELHRGLYGQWFTMDGRHIGEWSYLS